MADELKCECFTKDDKHNLKFSVMHRKRKLQEEKQDLEEQLELTDASWHEGIQKEIDRRDRRIAQHIELYDKIVNIKVC